MTLIDGLLIDVCTARERYRSVVDAVTAQYGYSLDTPDRVNDRREDRWRVGAEGDFLEIVDYDTYTIQRGPYEGPNDTVAYLADNVFIVLDSRSEIK